MLPVVPVPGLTPPSKTVRVIPHETYLGSAAHLDPAEQADAARLLASFENEPSTAGDFLVTVPGKGTSLIRFRHGLFVIYQHRIVSDGDGTPSCQHFDILFCWRSVTVDGAPAVSFPDWAGT